MKILVCIKQVPGTTQVEIDETTGTLKRDGVPAKMNPFDLYALETALRIKAAELLLKGFGDGGSGFDMLPVVLCEDIGGDGFERSES